MMLMRTAAGWLRMDVDRWCYGLVGYSVHHFREDFDMGTLQSPWRKDQPLEEICQWRRRTHRTGIL